MAPGKHVGLTSTGLAFVDNDDPTKIISEMTLENIAAERTKTIQENEDIERKMALDTDTLVQKQDGVVVSASRIEFCGVPKQKSIVLSFCAHLAGGPEPDAGGSTKESATIELWLLRKKGDTPIKILTEPIVLDLANGGVDTAVKGKIDRAAYGVRSGNMVYSSVVYEAGNGAPAAIANLCMSLLFKF